jgi:hypothetical protein
VEIHHQLHSDYWDSLLATLRGRRLKPVKAIHRRSAERFQRSRRFDLSGLPVLTLGHQDQLQHLCQHMLSHVNVWDYCRLIWVADLVSYAEQFAAEIDWTTLNHRAPYINRTLSLLHLGTPLSHELRELAGIRVGRMTQNLGGDFQGWPRVRPARASRSGLWRLLRDTLAPSEWWLRLRYNLGSTRPLLLARWVQHPLHIAGQLLRAGLEALGWPSASELAGQASITKNRKST